MLDVHAILREVSVVDAQKLLATSRAEKAAKEKEMQAMGGSRYQDLIDAADQIVSMHEASQRLDAALRDMPQLWDTLESSVARTMATTLSSEVSPVISVDAAQSHSHSNGDLVDLVVGASERMWVAMEQGNPLEALSIFKLVDGVTLSDMEGGPMMGIVAFELDAMPSFQHQCLRAPTKPTSFYERALLVLLELQHSSTAHALHSAFLQGRLAAAAALRQAASPSHKQHAVLASLELVLSTLNDARAMFAVPTSALSTALADIDVHPLELACTDWAIDAIRTWRQDLVTLLQSFHDVEAVASLQQVVQSQLDHRHSNESMMVTWQAVRQALDSRKTTSHDNNKDADDLWSIFASDVFATCTQRLFAQAFDAAATALDAALLRDDDERDDDMTATFVGRLVDIQHTGESSAATLQPVVASECIRVLFNVITTFTSHAFPSTTRLLRLAQHCLNLNAAMPELFQMSKPVVVAGLSDSWPSIEDAFATIQTEKATDHGTPWLLCSQLLGLYQEWRSVYHASWTQVPATITSDDDEDDNSATTSLLVWLPWCATPAVSHVLFEVATSTTLSQTTSSADLHERVQSHVRHELKQWIFTYMHSIVTALSSHRDTSSPVSFGQACALQCVFDVYFVRVLVGESEFLRFGWGDHDDMAPLLAWVDPVDWELFGSAVVLLVKRQYHMTRLLFSVFRSNDDDNSFADAGFVVSDAGLTMLEVAPPVPRFALLPVPPPQPLKRAQSATPTPSQRLLLPPPVNVKATDPTSGHVPPSTKRASSSIHQILSSSTSLLTSNATAASVTATAASAAAKGMSLFSSASSYLRE
ncbi:hypothetical protein DYB38_004147 [Aphanomyces astaci]|uniref:Conserved oligomeric Golgi complex subunit 1 n=1 Tax=Aphanomyces astaci TaxID=112090 RepID=A0A397DZ87_APHAT|nr:hypothetical protein DYB38_004147 [Aphanomyces astaci]